MKMGIVVSVAIIKDNKILLIQEGKKDNRGRWNIPSGRLGKGEKIVDGAIREAFEETGYHVKLVSLTGIYNFFSETGNQLIRFNFMGEIVGGELKYDNEEIIGSRWLEIKEMDNMKDEELWNAHSIREILKDIRTGKSYPVELLRDLL